MTTPVNPATILPAKSPDFNNALLIGNKSWADSVDPKLFGFLNQAQEPQILWIGCSDSRVPETTLLKLNAGDVFTHRNIANLINPTDISFPAVLNYALGHLETVKHIVLCGHISCGGANAAVTAVLGNSDKKTGPAGSGNALVDSWLTPLNAIIKDHMAFITSNTTFAAQAAALVRLNVQRGLGRIKADAGVQAAMADPVRQLQVHGAIYSVGTGKIEFLEGDAQIEPPIGDPTSINQYVNSNTWYHIYRSTVTWDGGSGNTNDALEAVNDNGASSTGKIHMALQSNVSGQHWQIRPSTTNPGSYQLVNLLLGASHALDVFGDDKTKPHLAAAGYYSGQQWQFILSDLLGINAHFWRLTNSYSGPGLCLDCPYGANEVSLTAVNTYQNVNTQFWRVESIRPITEPGFSV